MKSTLAQHTSGPWHANIAHPDLRAYADSVNTESGLHVCDVASYGASPTQRNANARLIAAAPDLLAALGALLAERYACGAVDGSEEFDADGNWTCTSPASAMARVALARAKGEQS
jgi:hypothetical protein